MVRHTDHFTEMTVRVVQVIQELFKLEVCNTLEEAAITMRWYVSLNHRGNKWQLSNKLALVLIILISSVETLKRPLLL